MFSKEEKSEHSTVAKGKIKILTFLEKKQIKTSLKTLIFNAYDSLLAKKKLI